VGTLLFYSGARAETVLTFNTVSSPNNPIYVKFYEPWAARIEKTTKGDVKIRFKRRSTPVTNAMLKSSQADAGVIWGKHDPENFG
jgi:TRAP-type C4-dicarboxylate transport system substrate-binding protein